MSENGTNDVFALYVDSLPSAQNAIDAIPGWTCALPPQFSVTAGLHTMFDDHRIKWAIECFGPIAGRRVLELGPLEANHTFILDGAGAAIDAIEANKLAYFRCLVAKEIMGLSRAKFFLGDFVKWLETVDTTYDLTIASGVLYHMKDPLHLLKLISSRSSAVYFWTHFYSDEALPQGDHRRAVFSGPAEVRRFEGIDVRLYPRTYADAQVNVTFCGGMRDEHRWIHRDDLLALLTALGYGIVKVAHEEPGHPGGPAFSVFARKDG